MDDNNTITAFINEAIPHIKEIQSLQAKNLQIQQSKANTLKDINNLLLEVESLLKDSNISIDSQIDEENIINSEIDLYNNNDKSFSSSKINDLQYDASIRHSNLLLSNEGKIKRMAPINNNTFVLGTDKGIILVFEIDPITSTYKQICKRKRPQGISDKDDIDINEIVVYSENMIITCSNDLSVSFWNINSQTGTITEHPRYKYMHNNIIDGVIKVTDNTIASFSSDNEIKIYYMQMQTTISVDYPNDDKKIWICYAINAYTNNKKESFIIGSFVCGNASCFIRFFDINGKRCETIERVYTDSQRGLFVTKDNKELIVACFIDRVKNAFVIIDLIKKVITRTIDVNNENIILSNPLYMTKYKDSVLCGTNKFLIQLNMDGILNTFELPDKDSEKEEYRELLNFGLGVVEVNKTKGIIVGINRTSIKQPVSSGRFKLISRFGLTVFKPS